MKTTMYYSVSISPRSLPPTSMPSFCPPHTFNPQGMAFAMHAVMQLVLSVCLSFCTLSSHRITKRHSLTHATAWTTLLTLGRHTVRPPSVRSSLRFSRSPTPFPLISSLSFSPRFSSISSASFPTRSRTSSSLSPYNPRSLALYLPLTSSSPCPIHPSSLRPPPLPPA